MLFFLYLFLKSNQIYIWLTRAFEEKYKKIVTTYNASLIACFLQKKTVPLPPLYKIPCDGKLGSTYLNFE